MKKLTAKEVFSIPNLMGYFRILLIPVFSYLYCTATDTRSYLIAAAVVLVSTLTDLFDGMVARKFHMVTDLGKMLDPIADKLTHAALAICLATHYPLMWLLILLMVVKESYMAFMGLRHLKEGKVNGATWYGKVCTALLFVSMCIMFCAPKLPLVFVNALILLCMATMLFTFRSYMIEFHKESDERS